MYWVTLFCYYFIANLLNSFGVNSKLSQILDLKNSIHFDLSIQSNFFSKKNFHYSFQYYLFFGSNKKKKKFNQNFNQKTKMSSSKENLIRIQQIVSQIQTIEQSMEKNVSNGRNNHNSSKPSLLNIESAINSSFGINEIDSPAIEEFLQLYLFTLNDSQKGIFFFFF